MQPIVPRVAVPLALCQLAVAQTPVTELQKLVAPDADFLDGFGRGVAIDGDRAVVTASTDSDRGAAYAFAWNGSGWTQTQKLVAPDAALGDNFGFGAALEGDLMAIGATDDDDLGGGSGSVYVLRWDGAAWSFDQKLVAPDGAEGDSFGWSLALRGGVLAVGAPNHDGQGSNAGTTYVFRDDGAQFQFEQELLVSTPGGGDTVGWTVRTDGLVVATSAITDDEQGTDSGSVYVFRDGGSGWVEEQRLIAAAVSAGDWFGWGLDVDGDALVVGATQHDGLGTDAGGAWLFRYDGSTWSETQPLAPTGLANSDNLGWSVAVQDGRAVIGAAGDSAGSGAAYLFQDSGLGWVEAHQWLPSDPGSSGFFLPNLGLSCALDGDRVLGGAPFADSTAATNTGAAYAFERTDLAFAALPPAAAGGQPLTLRLQGGLPGGPAGVLLTELAGQPTNLILLLGAFDAQGRAEFTVTVPAGLAGLDADLQGGGLVNPTTIGFSNEVTVAFL